jgi:hypothetical protein
MTPLPELPETDFLSCNRAGQLPPAQAQKIRMQLLPRLVTGVFLLFALAPFFFCFGTTIFPELLTELSLSVFGFAFVLIFLLTFGLGAISAGWRPLLGMLDLAGGRVEQADGRLTWRGRDYRGAVEGRGDLHLLPGDERQPGAYRFYYLPRSGYIANAERLFLGGTEADALAELRRALEDEFNFTEDDLAENRAGHLSPRQRTALIFSQLRNALLWAPFLLMGLAFAVLFPFFFILQPLWQGEPVEVGAWVGGLIGLIFGSVFASIIVVSGLNALRDLLVGAVQSVEGHVDKRIVTRSSGRSRRTDYYYTLNGQQFRVNRTAYNALVEGRPYRLHYLPRSKQVVSVEPLQQ